VYRSIEDSVDGERERERGGSGGEGKKREARDRKNRRGGSSKRGHGGVYIGIIYRSTAFIGTAELT